MTTKEAELRLEDCIERAREAVHEIDTTAFNVVTGLKGQISDLSYQIEGRDAEIESLIKQNGELYAALTRLHSIADKVHITEIMEPEQEAEFYQSVGFARGTLAKYKKI